MSSAVKLILGVSTLAMAVGFAGCDSGSSDTGGGAGVHPVPGAGSGNSSAGATQGTAGSIPGGGAGGSSSGVDTSSVPLIPTDGWVDGASNGLGIQGALFSYGDPTSLAGPPPMVSTITGAKACISGTAALVDMTSMACTTKMFTPPATDCFGEYWGAALALNLNQPIDPATGKGVKDALPYDASRLVGFSFDIEGDMIPASKDIRFNVENASGQFCNIPTKKIVKGVNTFNFTDVVKACYKITTAPPNPVVDATVQSSLIKISWQVVTNTSSTVPFNFCISDIKAILKPGTVLGTAGASGVAGSSASAGSAGSISAGGTSAGGSASAGTSAGGTSSAGTSAGGTSSAGTSAGGTTSAGGSTAGKGGTGG